MVCISLLSIPWSGLRENETTLQILWKSRRIWKILHIQFINNVSSVIFELEHTLQSGSLPLWPSRRCHPPANMGGSWRKRLLVGASPLVYSSNLHMLIIMIWMCCEKYSSRVPIRKHLKTLYSFQVFWAECCSTQNSLQSKISGRALIRRNTFTVEGK